VTCDVCRMTCEKVDKARESDCMSRIIHLLRSQRKIPQLPLAPWWAALYCWQGHRRHEQHWQQVVGYNEHDGYEHCEGEVALGVLQVSRHIAGEGEAEHVVDKDTNHAGGGGGGGVG
jgi:hypothetical protein